MIGLYLGKFAPLHEGHSFIIKKALSECDEVIIFIYDSPEVTDIPLIIRKGWIEKEFELSENKLTIVECWDAPKEIGYTKKAMVLQENYILKKLKGTKIDRFYSAEKYGEHVSIALNAKNCRVTKIKGVSATKIRNNPYAMRSHVKPFVYKDLITKVVFLGGVSCGKSTITEAMAKEFNTKFMPEYGREYWDKHQENRKLTPNQLSEIASGHINREDEMIIDCNEYMFVDTNAITTYLFHRYYFEDKVVPFPLWNAAENSLTRYDVVFLCDTDIPYDDTEDRSGDCQRDLLQKWTIQELIIRKIPYHVLTGSPDVRRWQVNHVLSTYKKWNKE